MKAVIIYSSETGFTQKYADWISEKTGIASIKISHDINPVLAAADLIIFGSPIYGGELLEKKNLFRLIQNKQEKKLICFSTGLQPWSPRMQEKVRKRILGEKYPEISFYYFPGGLDKERLRPSRKTELFLYRMMMNRHPERGETEKAFLERTERSGDFLDEALLIPLLEEVEAYKNGVKNGGNLP